MRPNFYAGLCSVCGVDVPANEGAGEPPPPGARSSRWSVKCKKCAGIVEGAKPKVLVTQDGRDVVFKPAEFLNGDLFPAYRKATNGARFDDVRRAQVAPIAKAITIVKALHEAGFAMDLPPSLAASLQAHSAGVREDILEAGTRANKVDEALQARGLTLFPFQKKGVQWLASRTGALLADDMGLGKTIQALIALPEDAPVLVVGPAVAKNVWEQEIKRWCPDRKVTVLEGRHSFRWPVAGEIVITNYDILSEEPGAPAPGTIVIADEAHSLKSNKAVRTRRFRTLSDVARKEGGKVWLLTATPLMNRPPELWGVLQAAGVAHECFGSWDNFTRLFNAQKNDWGAYIWGEPSPEVGELLRRVSLRRTKLEVLPELPTKTYRHVLVDLDAKTKKACAKAASLLETYTRFSRINEEAQPTEVMAGDFIAMKAAFQKKFGDFARGIDDAEKLLQRISGLEFKEIAKARAALATAKIPALLALVEDYEEQEEPLVVFSAHRAPIDIFVGRPGWEVITGDTSPEERARIQNDFQDGKLKGIAGTIKAAGVALTLTRASNAIFVDLEWTPALNSQAEDRLLRIGQTRGVLITTLVAKFPLDERVTELLSLKKTMIQNSVEASATIDPSIVVPEIAVDELSAIADGAAEEARKAQEAKEEADRRKQMFEARRAEIEEETEKRHKEQKRQARRERILRQASFNASERRVAQNPSEEWAAQALTRLAQLDPDRARERNDVGFNASDGSEGHEYAIKLEVGLTEGEWAAAIALCTKYHRQIGERPEES